MAQPITFSDRLKQLRDAAKMTQHELAARSGVHRQTIATLEAGERVPSWDTVQALARALGVDCKAFETLPAEAETPPAKKTNRKRKEK
jgi:transcriptional regulator with XRE-family HTH domain